MKHSAKRLLCLITVLAMALSLLPGFVLAENEPVLLEEGMAYFVKAVDAFDGYAVTYTPATNGEITVEIISSDPGFYIDIYDSDWLTDHMGKGAGFVTFDVTAGVEYEIVLSSYNIDTMYYAVGSVGYRITFLSNGETPEVPDEPEDPSQVPGATPENPKLWNGETWDYIGAGKTVWYLYDNYDNMVSNGVYSMMLHITCSTDYSVTYAGEEVPVDEGGFVNFEMKDTAKEGKYLFSITNNHTEEKFFSIEVKERPIYFATGLSLKEGTNTGLQLDASYEYTLYSFTPERTGVYQFTAQQMMVSIWGSPFNPINTTTDKTSKVEWTCTSVGQSVMIGFKGSRPSFSCTIIRKGDYIPPVEEPWSFYENTYEFDYVLDPAASVHHIDLTDGGEHTAVLGEDGFYHYGSAEGPLMVADLSTVEINLADAYTNGGLRAWLLNEDGTTLSKYDYNEALNEYLMAGRVPVTGELAMMLQEIGIANGWWVEGGLIFTETAPTDLTMAWMQLCGYLVYPPESNRLEGSITSGTEGDVTLELLDGDTVIATVTAADAYSISGMEAGIYTLRVSKENHVTREYTVTVNGDGIIEDGENITLDVKIHLIGDVTGDGKVNMGDVGKLSSHVKGTSALTDEYILQVANINGGSLNMGDTGALYAHVRGTKVLY